MCPKTPMREGSKLIHLCATPFQLEKGVWKSKILYWNMPNWRRSKRTFHWWCSLSPQNRSKRCVLKWFEDPKKMKSEVKWAPLKLALNATQKQYFGLVRSGSLSILVINYSIHIGLYLSNLLQGSLVMFIFDPVSQYLSKKVDNFLGAYCVGA